MYTHEQRHVLGFSIVNVDVGTVVDKMRSESGVFQR